MEVGESQFKTLGMKRIALTRGLFTTVDDVDFTAVSKHAWYSLSSKGDFYAARCIGGKPILMHRQIINAPASKRVDHKDGNTLNNRRKNLRICSHQNNMANQKRHKDNTSGFKGVSKQLKRWRAYLKTNGRQYHLGHFDSPEEAARAYDVAAKKHFGEFARPNFL